MVRVTFADNYKRTVSKIKDNEFRDRLEKIIIKISINPEMGKPMKYDRKGTREVYVGSFRLSYAYIKNKDRLIILELYHKDKQ